MFCTKCGSDLPESASFCAHCGTPVKPAPPGGAAEGPGSDDVSAFVGKNAAYYKEKFRKFTVLGVETFVPTWNWAACLCNFWWMLYRKLYLWALLWFLLSFIPFFGFAFWVASGIAGNYIYYHHAGVKIREARAATPPEKLPAVLSELGGVNGWVIPVAIVVTFGILLLAILIGIGMGLFCSFTRKSIPI